MPSDTIKYEMDRSSGYLRVDRPQPFSSVCPVLYGFIPQTYCADEVAGFVAPAVGAHVIHGDEDPLDICVFSDRTLPHGDVLLDAVPIGGFHTLDGDAIDEKIIAVLAGDATYGTWHDISDVPEPALERLRHYFLTYKHAGTTPANPLSIPGVYGRDYALELIGRAQREYESHFAELHRFLSVLDSPG